MAPSYRPALARRGPVGPYSLGETALLMAALSVLPLGLLTAAAAPVVTLSGLVGAVGAVGTVRLAKRAVARSTRTRVCVPHTEVCTEV